MMNIQNLPAMDLGNLHCSALIVEPTEAFLLWLESVASPIPLHEVYFAEENGIWLVPSVGAFPSEEDFAAFVVSIKPKLLLVELGRFPDHRDAFEWSINGETFDRFFNIAVRDTVSDIREL